MSDYISEFPSMYDEPAEELQKQGKFMAAAALWDKAAVCSLGHGRSHRYEEAADWCRLQERIKQGRVKQ